MVLFINAAREAGVKRYSRAVALRCIESQAFFSWTFFSVLSWSSQINECSQITKTYTIVNRLRIPAAICYDEDFRGGIVGGEIYDLNGPIGLERAARRGTVGLAKAGAERL